MTSTTQASPVTVVGLGGSLNQNSTTEVALRVALEGARTAGATTQAFDLRSLDLPMYDPGLETPPANAVAFADAVAAADAVVWASPLYHGTVSGVFKNALDWLQLLGDRTPAYLTDKPVGLIATAGGANGLQAINTMEFAVRGLRGWTLPRQVVVAEAWNTIKDGVVQDETVDRRLRALGAELVTAARRFAPPVATAVVA